MGAEIERHAHQPVGELLHGEDVGIGSHRDRRVGDDRAAADLASALDARVLHPAVIPPLAGVVHVRPSLFEELAVARMGIESFRAENVDASTPVHPGLAVHPFDFEALPLEQPLIVGDQFAQPLERGRILKHQRLHLHLSQASHPKPNGRHGRQAAAGCNRSPRGSVFHGVTGGGGIAMRMGGRAVEGTGLENRQARKRLVGSNPTPSAIS